MKAGQTNLEVGTKVKLRKFSGDESHLSDLTGEATHPFAFGCTKKGWIGIWLDNGKTCNAKVSDCTII